MLAAGAAELSARVEARMIFVNFTVDTSQRSEGRIGAEKSIVEKIFTVISKVP
jgi:hypothetical protein